MSALSYAEGKKDEEWGEKLAEGIYIMNRKKKPALDKSQLLLGSGDVRLYPDEIKRLRSCIDKLVDTNKELQACLDADPDEVEYKLAIRENGVVMADMNKQIKDMEDELTAKGYGSLVEGDAQKPAGMHLLEDENAFDDEAPAADGDEEPDQLVL